MTKIALDYEQLSDMELARLVVRRDANAVRVITGRNNQRLYRAAWSVLRDRAEAEEVVQDAYLKSFTAMTNFAGASSLSTWLTRIVINQALERKRTAERRERLLREQSVPDLDDYREKLMAGSETQQSPEAESPACGTGGMLSVSEAYIREHNNKAHLTLFGQDYNVEAYAICCSDMLIKDELVDNIIHGDTLGDGKTSDGHAQALRCLFG
jgi:RNA polymerase sigma factor (sigma-70 family)